MKILQISNYLYPHIGGIEQVARDCINALSEHEQKLICFNHENGTIKDIVDGVEVVRVGCQAKISSQSIALGYGRQLKKLINEFLPEVIIFHYPNPFVAYSLLKILKRHPEIKLVLYWHLDIFKQKFLKKFFHGQNKKLCKRADKIVATSPNYIEHSEYLPYYKEKCVVVCNCVNTDRLVDNEEISAKVEEIKNQNKGKTICFAFGRHVPYKGMEYLVRASKHLDENFKVYIGGKGPLTDSLKELATNDEKVCFLGVLSENDLVAYLTACDIFCFPSITKNEAFGIGLAEAMLFEKPVVTFTIEGSGVNYVSINKTTGLEVPNGDVVAYAKAITDLSNDKDTCKKFGQAGKERVLENFTLEKFKKDIKTLIERI